MISDILSSTSASESESESVSIGYAFIERLRNISMSLVAFSPTESIQGKCDGCIADIKSTRRKFHVQQSGFAPF